jgi:hypothetical protein
MFNYYRLLLALFDASHAALGAVVRFRGADVSTIGRGITRGLRPRTPIAGLRPCTPLCLRRCLNHARLQHKVHRDDVRHAAGLWCV